ncbi:MAG: proline--tRNA ligase [Planctomycetes bacterium]|nr:proline--tRNA ligase [Planctomycetota bacterium]
MARNITPRSEDYSRWYTDVIAAGELADYSDVRGCMVIRPTGYSIWERIQQDLDARFKDTGHVNAYFPLYVPISFFGKEAQHVEGFAMECAVVTHYGLYTNKNADGTVEVKVDDTKKLDEPLVVRPTSETIINAMYAKWVQSWRDLPILINQWANVSRWEMRTRLFLRTSEFLWQEGHTAHANAEEAEAEALKILQLYKDFMQDVLAIPIHEGPKSESEKFPGAIATYAVEGYMQDGKALQMGTSHNLGQNFAKAFGTQFQNKDGELEYVYQTSWGVSTRLVGAVIMAHADDEGLVLPPKIADTQVVIVPIWKKDAQKAEIMQYADEIFAKLREAGVRVKVDDRDSERPSQKFFHWEQRGIPLRIEIGPRDLENKKCVLKRRFDGEKLFVDVADIAETVTDQLENIQTQMFELALKRRDENTVNVDTYGEFKDAIENNKFVLAHWDGSVETEEKIKADTKATIRCIPFAQPSEPGIDIISGKPSQKRVLFAKSY